MTLFEEAKAKREEYIAKKEEAYSEKYEAEIAECKAIKEGLDMDKETKELCRFYEKRIAGLEEEVNRYKSLVDVGKIGKIVSCETEALEEELRAERLSFNDALKKTEEKIQRLESENTGLGRMIKRLEKEIRSKDREISSLYNSLQYSVKRLREFES